MQTEPSTTYWQKRKVLVTGGASFIGSHLVEKLVELGAEVKIVDDLSTGRVENLKNVMSKLKESAIVLGDLRTKDNALQAFYTGLGVVDTVFHLAADHGGRGYVDLHQAGPATNFYLDGLIFYHAMRLGVRKVVFASSGCVYPNRLQTNVHEQSYLLESATEGPNDADNLYGWAKLMGEFTLRAYAKEFGLKAASCRYFTVYGPRGVENHAVMAMLARAFVKQNPFEIWGDGTQIRNWTYVDDIVSGTILAGEKIDDGTAVNLGTTERIRVLDAAKMACEIACYEPEFKFLTHMPTGPMNRVADNSLAKKLLGWEPKVNFADGIKRTGAWYFRTKDASDVEAALERLTER